MIDPHIYAAFSDELQKEAGIPSQFLSKGKSLLSAASKTRLGGVVKDTGSLLRNSIDPTRVGGAMREGLHEMSNMAGHKVDARKAFARGERGPINTFLDNFRSQTGIHGAERKAKRLGKAYKDDYSQGSGAMNWARRQGLMSGAMKYTGDSKVRKGLNMARRALPGEKTVNLVGAAQGAYGAMNDKVDPETGRQKGIGERLGKATIGVTSNIVGMRHGMIAGMVGQGIGERIGATAGRGFDTARSGVNKLQHRYQTATGASPAPTGAG